MNSDCAARADCETVGPLSCVRALPRRGAFTCTAPVTSGSTSARALSTRRACWHSAGHAPACVGSCALLVGGRSDRQVTDGRVTHAKRIVPVSEFRKPPRTRRLTERERRAFLRRHDPDRLRLPLLHEPDPGDRVVLTRATFHASAALWSADGSLIVAYSWTIGRLHDRVTATFASQVAA
jgi:hypothetical protein